MTLSEALEASVSSSNLFLPKIIGDNMYLDVKILAKTPSFMSYLIANNLILPKRNSNQEIRMLSINCHDSDYIDQQHKQLGFGKNLPPHKWTDMMRRNDGKFNFNDW